MAREKNLRVISLLVIMATIGLASSLLVDYGGGADPGSVGVADAALVAEETGPPTLARMNSAAAGLANDQWAFLLDGESTHTVITWDVLTCGGSTATAAPQGAVASARSDPLSDFADDDLACDLAHALELMARAMNPKAMEKRPGAWQGTMIAANVSDAAAGGQFVVGDVALTVDDFINPDVDLAFSNVHDLESGVKVDDMRIPFWENIPLDGIAFGSRSLGSADYIRGQFVGEDRAAVVGVFGLNDFVGSFGANRTPGE